MQETHMLRKKTVTGSFLNKKVCMCINVVTMPIDRYLDLCSSLPFGCKCTLYLLLGPSERAHPVCRTELWELRKLLSVSLFSSANPQGFLLPSSHLFSYSSPERNCSHVLLPPLTWELSRVLSVKTEISSAVKSCLNLLDIWEEVKTQNLKK